MGQQAKDSPSGLGAIAPNGKLVFLPLDSVSVNAWILDGIYFFKRCVPLAEAPHCHSVRARRDYPEIFYHFLKRQSHQCPLPLSHSRRRVCVRFQDGAYQR